MKDFVVLRAFKLLEKRDRIRAIQVLSIQVLLACLDLIGVAIIGVLGALTISSASSKGPGNRVSLVLKTLGIEDQNIQTQAMYLGLLAALLLVSKTLLSMYLIKRTTFYLSRRGARLSADLIQQVLQFPYLRLRKQSLMEWQYQLMQAVDVISVGIITTSILMISDIALLIIMGFGLLYLEPSIALGALTIFSLSASIVYLKQHKKSLKVGSEIAKVNIETNENLQVVLEAYRDLFVRSALQDYGNRIRKLRLLAADLSATRTFMPYVGKFTLEVAMVFGFLFIAATQFLLNDASRAVANIAVFFVASARISPAILRIQQGLLMLKSNRGLAESAFSLIDEVSLFKSKNVTYERASQKLNRPSNTKIIFDSVDFMYPTNPNFEISNLSFELTAGASLALIGSSGSGKSTIADLLLGLLIPSSGSVKIGDMTPKEFHARYPGAVAYVPQKPILVNASVRENLALGLTGESLEDKAFWLSLEKAQLASFINHLPHGLDTPLGIGGIDLSGGQIQRLCLARALVTNPEIIVLDEATSALDGKTEFLVSEAIKSLEGTVTILVIAHRLSTVKNFERVMYFDNGKLKAVGSFKTLVAQYPDIAEQAALVSI